MVNGTTRIRASRAGREDGGAYRLVFSAFARALAALIAKGGEGRS